MFEEQGRPGPLGVAMLTSFTELPLMLVIFLMAGVAVGRCLVFVQVALMAGCAFGCNVVPPQRVLCVQLMVEGDRFPVGGSVAGLALFTVRPFMRVIFFVTGIALRGGVLEGRSQVAFIA